MSNFLYSVGSVAVLVLLCKDENGALTDPATLTVTMTPKVALPSTYTIGAGITRTSLGTFRLEVPITEKGEWLGSALATGGTTPAAQPFVLSARA